MITACSAVGSTVANYTHFLANCPQLANLCQLKNEEKQGIASSWQLAVHSCAANLPTDANPRGHWLSGTSQVGENSPSYYVGEGTELPSSVRRGVSAGWYGAPSQVSGRSILALDLGTQTGWALLARDDSLTSGSQSFKPQRFEGGGMRFLRFKRWLTELKTCADGITAIYFEEVRRHLGVDAAHAYGGFLATLTAWCEHHQIPYQGVPVGTIKKHATGKGNASKDEMVSAVVKKGFMPTDDNEADALAILFWAIETQEF